MVNRRGFITELEALTSEVICMGNALEIMITKVEQVLKNGDKALIAEIMEKEEIIDAMECKIERECIELIAKQSPVASDLRRISACMRLISDMERIGDHCTDICEYILLLDKENYQVESEAFYEMFTHMKKMVHNTIRCFAKEDAKLASQVTVDDDKVDEIFAQEIKRTTERMKQDSNYTEYGVCYILILKYVERMADHASNIAEWVLYLVSGNLEQSMHFDQSESNN